MSFNDPISTNEVCEMLKPIDNQILDLQYRCRSLETYVRCLEQMVTALGGIIHGNESYKALLEDRG